MAEAHRTRLHDRRDEKGRARRRVLQAHCIITLGILSRVVHTGVVAFDKYLGDALYAAMVYAILRLLWRGLAAARLAVSAMAVMTFIELFQLDNDSGTLAHE